jgi:hypothetical protein
MHDHLDEKLEAVNDEVSFIAFVAALAADHSDEVEKEKLKPSSPFGPGANGWENTTIDSFLEAAARGAEDRMQSPFYEAPKNAWKRCAEILITGKGYE